MNRSGPNDIIFKADGQNHLKTPTERSHNSDEAAIIELLRPLALEAARKAAEVDFKAILDARQSDQSDNSGSEQ